MANPAAGELARFLSPAGEPVLAMLPEVGPVHHGPPAHVHPAAEESFEVLEGHLELLVGRGWRRVGAGESLTVPRGTRHTYRGVPGEGSRTVVRVAPGESMRAFLGDLYGLAAQERLRADGSPRLRDAARLFREHPDAMTVAGVPAWLQPTLWRVLAAGADGGRGGGARPLRAR